MADNWKAFDLQGGGLQSANLRLARLLKRRRVAYALIALFPLGLHRDYLGDRRGAWLYRTVAAAAAICLLSGQALIAGILGAALGGCALYDAARTEDRLTAINKRLRMQVYLAQTGGAPAGYRGRFPDAPDGGAGRHPGRAPSFAEQERLLRELAKQRKREG